MIGAIPIDLTHGKRITEVSFTIAGPGIVRAASFMPRPRLVMARGEPEFEEQLTLFVETRPGESQRRHHFVIVDTGATPAPPEGSKLVWVATAISAETRATAHVFELKLVQ
jgi:hypothetical protein